MCVTTTTVDDLRLVQDVPIGETVQVMVVLKTEVVLRVIRNTV
jgi:hypothetical protein